MTGKHLAGVAAEHRGSTVEIVREESDHENQDKHDDSEAFR